MLTALVNAEPMPTWFNLSYSKSVFPYKGFSGNFLLLNWCVMGMVVMFALTCNLRANFLRSEYGRPIDTTEDIVKDPDQVADFEVRLVSGVIVPISILLIFQHF